MSIPAPPLDPPPPSAPRPQAWRRLGILLASGVVALAVVTALSHTLLGIRPEFNSRPLENIKRSKPDIVFIGNSMVYTRFDERFLNELVAPTKVELLTEGATLSAIWYAQLKYSVVASRVPVRRVAIFFRDRELTLPTARTTGRFAEPLERARSKRDPLMERKLAPAAGPLEELNHKLDWLVPVERLRGPSSYALENGVFRVLTLGQKADVRVLRQRINRLFRVDELRSGADDSQWLEDQPTPFAEVVDGSFLPDMIDLAKKHDFDIWFVRVKKRRIAEGKPERPGFPKYLADLRRYLTRQGAHLIDLTSDPWETIALYGSGDHIAPRHRRNFTRHFVESHPELFRFADQKPADPPEPKPQRRRPRRDPR